MDSIVWLIVNGINDIQNYHLKSKLFWIGWVCKCILNKKTK